MQQFTETIQSLLEPWLLFLADDPMLRLLQGSMLLVGILVIFLVFFTTRDILLRTNSFLYMFVCILLVAAFPVAGFLLYLLIRPARTLRERELYAMVVALKAPKKTDVAPSEKSKAPKKK
ncbi:MAG: hypothetical protein PHU04_03845 [Candidatus Peribacteraceae bacterium]|nr:hypothetical protein [Candidatus Peribacteraceae bacterium]